MKLRIEFDVEVKNKKGLLEKFDILKRSLGFGGRDVIRTLLTEHFMDEEAEVVDIRVFKAD